MIDLVMISSTFTDLQEHRAALIKTINETADLKAEVMESDSAKVGVDVIDSSLDMVRKSAAYVGVISHKYGQTPVCPKRNPRKLSITELEFDEALRLKKPILLFLMGDDHPLTKKDIEQNPSKKKKLAAFRERAKTMGPDNTVHRVYAIFESVQAFKEKAAKSIVSLHDHLRTNRRSAGKMTRESTGESGGRRRRKEGQEPSSPPIPKPPAFYAQPPYIGSHTFVGRGDQLDTLNEWALPADTHPVLLYDAIGGSGKSMLTWEWVHNHAPLLRKDWAGSFW